MQALSISKELTDVRAERAVLRLLARGYRAVGLSEMLVSVQGFLCHLYMQLSNPTPGCHTRSISMLQCARTASLMTMHGDTGGRTQDMV